MDKHAENGPTRKNSARKDKKDAYKHNIRKKEKKTKQNPVQLAQQGATTWLSYPVKFDDLNIFLKYGGRVLFV